MRAKVVIGLSIAAMMAFALDQRAQRAEASAVVAVAAAPSALNMMNSHHLSPEQSATKRMVLVSIPEGSDGLIETEKFYLDGPIIRLCPFDTQVYAGRACVHRESVATSFLGFNTTKIKRALVPGQTAQEFLDARFGDGNKEHTGMTVNDDQSVTLFYRNSAHN